MALMTEANPKSRVPRLRLQVHHLDEWRFVLIFGLVALAISSIPYVLGAAWATDDRVFGGFVYAVEDCYSYVAKMRQGAEGAWLFHLPYTPEPHPGSLFVPFHLILGKIAALSPGDDLTARMVWVYHGARLALGLGLLLTVYRFIAALTESVAVRRLAWLMVTFGGGLGWLLFLLGQSNWLGSMPLDFILPDGFTFLVLYAFPHLALARTLLLWGLLFLWRAWHPPHRSEAPATHHASRNTTLKWAILAGLLWLVMGLIVPFYVAVAWAVTGAAWVVLGLRSGRLRWREGLVAALAALLSVPVVAYSAWTFTTDPVYALWAAQNLVLSPHPLHYLAAYGIPLALAGLAVGGVWHGEGREWLALAWVAVVPLLVYLPFNLQRRLVEGVQVPLSLLASLGVSRLGVRGSRLRIVTCIVLVVLPLTNGLLVMGNILALQGSAAPIYRDAGELAALDWLGEQVQPDGVVFASYETGNYLPVRVGARAFVGHGPESIHAEEKRLLVARFFDAATDDAWRQQLLLRYGVDYVFWGPIERHLGAVDLQTAPYLRRVYEMGAYAIFEVDQ